MSVEIHFCGGAGTVTGSKYLITYRGKKVLVDCGLFQGLKTLRLKNWAPMAIEPSEITAVILSHAHIDHSGYIPRLINDGFSGTIYSTAATKDVCEILLPDSGYLNEEEAAYLNKRKRTKHSPALPLFTMKDAERSLRYFREVPYEQEVEIFPGCSFHLRYAGHILGAASIVLSVGTEKIAFTGDVGRPSDPIFFEPSLLPQIDYLITESTYGNRRHSPKDPLESLARVVNDTFRRQGAVILPAFAVGRAQTLMLFLSELVKAKKIPNVPMYLNSPMATDFTALLRRHADLHKLTEAQCREMREMFKFVTSSEESKSLNERKGPMIIISASSMLTGGRILHHLKSFCPYPENSVVLTGFQAAGTRGEALMNGATEIKIHGEYVPVRAHVETLEGLSAHADYTELITWFKKSMVQPERVFVTHGEPSASDEFRRRLTETFNWNCYVPGLNEAVQVGVG